MRKLCLLVLAIAAYVSPAIADTYPRQAEVDALHYAFHLTLSDQTDEILGETAVGLRFTRAGLVEFALDLTSAAEGKGMAVSEVSCGGSPVRYQHESDRLRIFAPKPSQAGQRMEFTIRYRGIPASGLRIGKNKHGERTFFSENWPDRARQWLPAIDHPYDKATSEFFITAPAHYQVIANGLLQEEVDLGDGQRLTHWKQSKPIATWLNAIGVAQFAVHHADPVRQVPLETWVFHQDQAGGIGTFEGPSRRALAYFQEQIGPYPYEKLASVQAAGLRGGTEHASAIFYDENVVTGRPATNLVAHEVAHQWFGDAVTERDWDDVWLSEGFATYFALLFTEHDEGRDAFVAGLKRNKNIVFTFEKRNPRLAVIHDNLADMRQVLNPLVYQKAGWTLHMLRHQVGTDTYWVSIRNYFNQYRDGNAATADFRRIVEEASGADLSWFFRQWLNRPGSPSVEGFWTYDESAGRIMLELTQNQSGDAFRLPIEIGVTLGGNRPTRVESIEMTQKTQRFELKADKEPESVELDPNVWVLMESRLTRRASATP